MAVDGEEDEGEEEGEEQEERENDGVVGIRKDSDDVVVPVRGESETKLLFTTTINTPGRGQAGKWAIGSRVDLGGEGQSLDLSFDKPRTRPSADVLLGVSGAGMKRLKLRCTTRRRESSSVASAASIWDRRERTRS